MPYYRITITALSPLGTRLVSGTVWGHLAWAIRYLEGEAALKGWLSQQQEEPWLLSSFMPAGMLPRPLLKPSLRDGGGLTLNQMRQQKRVRKEPLLEEKLFLKLRTGLSEPILEQALQDALEQRIGSATPRLRDLKAHNHIDRLTGTTPERGGLFFEEVQFVPQGAILQGFMFTSVPCLDRLQSLFEFVGENGYGGNASTGNGHLQCVIGEETSLFGHVGNRAMSLSHGVVSQNMHQVRYRQHVHFGKLGGLYTKGGFSPFKYPLLMMCPGATFTPADQGPFGSLLDGVHHDSALASVRHHALHLPLAFTEVEP